MTDPKQRSPIPFPSKEATGDDVVARIQAGDAGAFEALYRQHAPRLFALSCRMAGSAEDGAQTPADDDVVEAEIVDEDSHREGGAA